MTQWEYKSEYIALIYGKGENPEDLAGIHADHIYRWQEKLEAALNKLGAAGWELVSIDPHLVSGDGVDGYAVFKRPK